MVPEQTRVSGSKSVVVNGDISVDWLEVSTPPVGTGEEEAGRAYNWQSFAGVRLSSRPGGALVLADFLRAASGNQVRGLNPSDAASMPPEKVVQSFVRLDRFPYSTSNKDGGSMVYRVGKYKGYSGPAGEVPYLICPSDDDAEAGIVVLDDAGNGFRDQPEAWPAAMRTDGTPIVIVKMSWPIAQGPLWQELQRKHAERMVVVVSADHLRREGVQISRRLSWERTAKEFVWQMACNPSLFSLGNCAYLVVRFGVDGAIMYTRRNGVVESRLFFDPKVGEDAFGDVYPGHMLGIGAAFVSGLTAQVAEHGLAGLGEGVRQGILSSRRLWKLGFGRGLGSLGYPVAEMFGPGLQDDSPIVDVQIPNPTATEPADPEYWCILNDQSKDSLEDVAYACVVNGPDHALRGISIGQFGNLKTFDRSEIESFRSIRNLMREYLLLPKPKRPLCIAVFGSPGSGKSFGVTQVAESVAQGDLQTLEFNLAQFSSLDDLVGALHRVRDAGLSGKIPLAFFDEFDSEFQGNKLGWLRYLLAPMQDGVFRHGETMHPIGRAIFVFAGGTCSTFEQFYPYGDNTDAANGEKPQAIQDQRVVSRDEFRAAKGPDFVSRLRGYVNIKGPNPNGDGDDMYIIRRALTLRVLIEQNSKHLLEGNGKLRIDSGVLRALIKVPQYKHGIRSMQAVIEMSLLAGRSSFEQSALPSPEQLDLHVDAEMFSRLVVRDVLLGSAREVFAKALHEKFLLDQAGKKSEDDLSMAPWDHLREDLKESNRQQADHIPVKLKAVGCGFAPVAGRDPVLFKFDPEEIELMSKMEHDRWVSERFLSAWSYGLERDVARKISPYLVGWELLEDSIREYDRMFVRSIPEILSKAGFEIYRLK